MSIPWPKLVKGVHFCQSGLKKHRHMIFPFTKRWQTNERQKTSVTTAQESVQRGFQFKRVTFKWRNSAVLFWSWYEFSLRLVWRCSHGNKRRLPLVYIVSGFSYEVGCYRDPELKRFQDQRIMDFFFFSYLPWQHVRCYGYGNSHSCAIVNSGPHHTSEALWLCTIQILFTLCTIGNTPVLLNFYMGFGIGAFGLLITLEMISLCVLHNGKTGRQWSVVSRNLRLLVPNQMRNKITLKAKNHPSVAFLASLDHVEKFLGQIDALLGIQLI